MSARKHDSSRYWALLESFRWPILWIFCCAAVAAGIGLLQPYLFHYAIDEIALKQGLDQAQRVQRLIPAALVMLAMIGISFVANYLYAYQALRLNQTVTARLRYALLRHMLHLPLHELTKMKTGGAVARLNQDTATVSQFLSRGLVTPGVALLQAVTALTMVLFLNWKMTVAAMLVILPMGVLTHLFAKRLRPLFGEISRLGSELSARSIEMFGGVRVSRIYRREGAERRAYIQIYHRMMRKTLEARRQQIAIDSFWQIAFALIQIVIVTYGIYLIIHGEATVGDILAIIMYANRIMGPIETVARAYDQLQEDLAVMDRIFDVLDMTPDKLDAPGAIEAPARVESLTFNHVTFSYNGTTTPALSDVTFHVKGGQTVALVGKSGAGKSTLTDLLSRFYDPQSGAIYVNGQDLRSLKVKTYRSLLGLVQQETFLFDGTVRENIAYAVPRATNEAILDAARRANAHEFIEQLPNGYETMIGERGVKLSGGQRQRISIARAFLVDPEILILDEATSSLDTENEQAIQVALRELLRNRTTFIIAHRLSTVTHADTIIVLENGRICEMGPHDTLTAERGRYYGMIERQHLAVQL